MDNSAAIEIAQKVDPDGLRTVGILTKLDLIDDGLTSLKVG